MERINTTPGHPQPVPEAEPAPRRPYTPPTVTSYGNIEQLTQGGGVGDDDMISAADLSHTI